MKKFLLLIAAALISCATTWAQGVASVVGTYNCNLYLSLGTPIPDNSTDFLPNMPVTLEKGSTDGTVNFAIYNLTIQDMQLGDIKLNDVPLVADGDGYKFGENQPVRLSLMSGMIQADVNINAETSYVKNGTLYADVDIVWIQDASSTTPIYVRVTGPKQGGTTPTASAFALPNPGFNGQWVESHPWDSANGYFDWDTLTDEFWEAAAYKRAQFIQPEGWVVAHVTGVKGLGATAVGSCETLDANKPDYALTLTNNPNPFMESQIVPGYVSLGTTWATIDGIDWATGAPKDADGGAFGGVAFTAQPDAISLRYKRSHGEANPTERASVIAYTWKGTYQQANVPAQTALASPVQITMYGRDRNILGLETTVGGEVTKSADAQLVAKAEYYIEGDAADWQQLEVPFVYTDGATTPDSLNVIISANDYFADRSLMGAGNSLTIDDVQLVYWHELSSISYDGKELDLNDLNVNEAYDAAKLAYTVKGRGAKVTTSYDEASHQLTITVEAQNVAEDPEAVTNYVVQFGTETGINDATATQSTKAKGVYTLSGVRVADQLTPALPKGVYIVGGRKVVK